MQCCPIVWSAFWYSLCKWLDETLGGYRHPKWVVVVASSWAQAGARVAAAGGKNAFAWNRRADVMEDRKFYASVAVCVLAYLSTVLGITAVSTSYWADLYRYTPIAADYAGHFGPWKKCSSLSYNQEVCGEHTILFYPSSLVVAAGVFSAMSVALIADICILAPLHMVMLCTKQKLLVSYKHAVTAKLWFALIGGVLSAFSVLLFCLPSDGREQGFIVRKGWSFYLEVVVLVLNVVMLVVCGLEYYLLKQLGGDPTKYNRDVEGTKSRTIVNPGYREGQNGGGGSAGGGGGGGRRSSSSGSSVVSTVLTSGSVSSSRSSSSRRRRSLSSTGGGGGGSGINHAGHNHRRRSRSSSVGGSGRRSSNKSRRIRRRRSHSLSTTEAGALPHQVGPDGQIISNSNLSLNNGYRVPPPLTMLPLKSSLKKKKPVVVVGPDGLDTTDGSCGTTTTMSPMSGGGAGDESVSSWTTAASDVTGLSIHNPHFSPESLPSPSLTRNGSVKKVRIQTRSTDV
ncbi:unnamed protein product [Notodromas monacha]|uniref:Uncharacterized protein n=1 Tax=Notodromas monacha TaxID=399045 RepID=A0A7R9GBP5_9CRUS|nr:unnamed protein product [Notodromas monacha]CAG0915026.1 unnamed protein product [Notodromas monacha]